MERRKFVKQLGLGLAAGWVWGKLAWPVQALAGSPALRLALLADAHLKNGDAGRPEAQALARAVAEIKASRPSPDLVLFAGDLAHKGRPDALDLGREILSDLPSPLWAVRGEGDQARSGSAWGRRFGDPWFSRAWGAFHLLGLDTALNPASREPVFEIGEAQRRWLARELAGLNPATPLVVLSHAPLARLFRPWQQWTGDAPEITDLLTRFCRVLCLHGHVHGSGIRDQGPVVGGEVSTGGRSATHNADDAGQVFLTEHRLVHFSLPATAWPRPQPVQGTPAVARPGVGPHGCGWTFLTVSPATSHLQAYLWQA